MIKSFLITNSKNESLLLTLSNPLLTGIIIETVRGIGPEGAEINTTDIANSDKSIFNSARREKRNIIFSLVPYICENHMNMEQTRMKIYNFFPLKEKIKIQCITTEKNIYVNGYVEKCEPNIFTKNENIEISIICPDGIWKGEKSSNFNLGGKARFKFPFSNECTAYSFYSKWKDSKKFTWEQVNYYGWTWDNADVTIGKVSSLVDRYNRLLNQQPLNKTKINLIVEEIYKIDTENFMQVFPIN